MLVTYEKCIVGKRNFPFEITYSAGFFFSMLYLFKKMKFGLSGLLHPRRRGILMRLLALITFIGFVCLWLKSDLNTDKSHDGGRSIREVPGHVELFRGNFVQAEAAALLEGGGTPGNSKLLVERARDSVEKPVEKMIHVMPPPVHLQAAGQVAGASVNLEEKSRALAMFAADDLRVVPGLGEMGKAVHLSGPEAALADEIIKVEAFNRILSDKISLNRSVPDSRDPL